MFGYQPAKPKKLEDDGVVLPPKLLPQNIDVAFRKDNKSIQSFYGVIESKEDSAILRIYDFETKETWIFNREDVFSIKIYKVIPIDYKDLLLKYINNTAFTKEELKKIREIEREGWIA